MNEAAVKKMVLLPDFLGLKPAGTEKGIQTRTKSKRAGTKKTECRSFDLLLTNPHRPFLIPYFPCDRRLSTDIRAVFSLSRHFPGFPGNSRPTHRASVPYPSVDTTETGGRYWEWSFIRTSIDSKVSSWRA